MHVVCVIDRLRVLYIRLEEGTSQCRPWAMQGQNDYYPRASPVHDHRSNANSLTDDIQTGSQILRTHRTLGGNSARWLLVSGEQTTSGWWRKGDSTTIPPEKWKTIWRQ